MPDPLSRVIVGNLVINPDVLREFLKKSHYFMSYDPKSEKVTLSVNDGNGGLDILEIRNTSYESAEKLARGLGLKGERGALNWSKWNPVYSLWHDGSSDAEKLRMEMLRLGLPFKLINHPYINTGSGPREVWAWCTGGHIYMPGMWTVDKVLEEMRSQAGRYQEQLTTAP